MIVRGKINLEIQRFCSVIPIYAGGFRS